ncbi:MAG TPA: site-specific integrase, partial [Pyrinomonadaceae bacterium]|nr:site-specific integrase [Pyrinomonadaceae bacterium]
MTHQRDLIREYISYIRVEKGLSKNSLEAYERDLRKLEAWTETNSIALLTLERDELREWLMDLSRAKISENSKRRLISAVRGFYKFLMT